MQIWREEVSGPVLCVKTFSTEGEAIELANDTRYGLGAAVISNDLERCERITRVRKISFVLPIGRLFKQGLFGSITFTVKHLGEEINVVVLAGNLGNGDLTIT